MTQQELLRDFTAAFKRRDVLVALKDRRPQGDRDPPGIESEDRLRGCLHIHFHEGIAVAAYGKPGGPHDALPESTD